MRLTFTVTDSGIGIVAADLKRLFRPFAQASEDVARRYGGAGLGLVFVKRIAKAMGGDLDGDQQARPRQHVPADGGDRSDAAPARARGARAGAKPVARLRVLCVEDNPYGRVVLNAVLRELGHRVSFVGTGEAAVETVARNEHDAVLMDVALPGIDGIEATRRIRALPPPAGRIPIIGVSGRTEPRDDAAAQAAGHERLSAQARVARGVQRGAADGGAQARLIKPMITSSRMTAPMVALMIDADHSAADRDADARQQPAGDEGADDADDDVADQAEAHAAHDQAREPPATSRRSFSKSTTRRHGYR